MPSFDTTFESFHCKESTNVEEFFFVIFKEIGRLKKELEDSKK